MQEHLIPETPITPIVSRKWLSGTQDVYRFSNGYGASVIRNEYSYGGSKGLFELGVTRFSGKGNFDWELTQSTPITDDVIGHLTTGGVQDLLVRIQALEAAV